MGKYSHFKHPGFFCHLIEFVLALICFIMFCCDPGIYEGGVLAIFIWSEDQRLIPSPDRKGSGGYKYISILQPAIRQSYQSPRMELRFIRGVDVNNDVKVIEENDNHRNESYQQIDTTSRIPQNENNEKITAEDNNFGRNDHTDTTPTNILLFTFQRHSVAKPANYIAETNPALTTEISLFKSSINPERNETSRQNSILLDKIAGVVQSNIKRESKKNKFTIQKLQKSLTKPLTTPSDTKTTRSEKESLFREIPRGDILERDPAVPTLGSRPIRSTPAARPSGRHDGTPKSDVIHATLLGFFILVTVILLSFFCCTPIWDLTFIIIALPIAAMYIAAGALLLQRYNDVYGGTKDRGNDSIRKKLLAVGILALLCGVCFVVDFIVHVVKYAKEGKSGDHNKKKHGKGKKKKKHGKGKKKKKKHGKHKKKKHH